MSEHSGLGSEAWLWRELQRWVSRATATAQQRYGSRWGKFDSTAYARVVRSRAKKEWSVWGKDYTDLPIFVTAVAYALRRALRECCDNPECTTIQATALYRVWQSKLRPYVLDAIDERVKHREQTADVKLPGVRFLRSVNQELKGTRESVRRLGRKLSEMYPDTDKETEDDDPQDEGEPEESV